MGGCFFFQISVIISILKYNISLWKGVLGHKFARILLEGWRMVGFDLISEF